MSIEVRYLTALSTGAIGLATGLAASYPAILFRSLPNGISGVQRLAIWQGSYYAGIATIVPLPLLAGVGFASAAYMSSQQTGSRKTGALAGATAFSFAHVLFTLAFMATTNKRLLDLNKLGDRLSVMDLKEAEKLIASWQRLHGVRIASLGLAFVVGLSQLV